MEYTPQKDFYSKIISLTARRLRYKNRIYYIVWSYATPVLGICLYTDEVILNKTRYSATTSRHQNIVQSAVDDMCGFRTARKFYDLPRGNLYGFLGLFA